MGEGLTSSASSSSDCRLSNPWIMYAAMPATMVAVSPLRPRVDEVSVEALYERAAAWFRCIVRSVSCGMAMSLLYEIELPMYCRCSLVLSSSC